MARLHFPLVCALLLVLAGCVPVKHAAVAPAFESADVSRIAIFRAAADGITAGAFGQGGNLELGQATLDTTLATLARSGAALGVEIMPPRLDQYGLSEDEAARAAVALRVALVQAGLSYEEGERDSLDVAGDAGLLPMAAASGTPYVAALQTVAWRKTTGRRILDMGNGGPPHGIGLELAVVDARTGQPVWYGKRLTDFDPHEPENVRAMVDAMLFEMLTGRTVSASSFLPVPEGRPVSVSLYEGESASGPLKRREGFDLVIESDGAERRFPLQSVRLVRGFGERLFPSQVKDTIGQWRWSYRPSWGSTPL